MRDDVFSGFRCLTFKAEFVFGFAGLAPLARHSFATAQKSTSPAVREPQCPSKQKFWIL